jgi:hypothetical protein
MSSTEFSFDADALELFLCFVPRGAHFLVGEVWSWEGSSHRLAGVPAYCEIFAWRRIDKSIVRDNVSGMVGLNME